MTRRDRKAGHFALSAQPSFAECRQAAKSVRQAEYGRQAITYLRPRSITGVHRERPPLAVLLYLLSRRNLVVWHSTEEFIALRPPDTPPLSSNRAAVRLPRLDRWWDILVIWLPPFLVLLLAFPLALLLLIIPSEAVPAPLLVGLLIAVGIGFLYPPLVMLTWILNGLLWLGRRLMGSVSGRQEAGELLVAQNWSISLCHITDPSKTENLLRAAQERVSSLVAAAEPSLNRSPTVTLVWNERCVTSAATREAARIAAEVTRITEPGIDLLILRKFGDKSVPKVDVQLPDPVHFVSLFLLCTAGLVAYYADVVADQEKAACGTQCDNRPASYGDALYWLLSHLFLRGDPGNLSPVTAGVRMLGLTVTLLGATMIGIIIASGIQAMRARRKKTQELEEEVRQSLESSVKRSWGSVFINYRQGLDNLAVAGLYRTLADRFGSDKVFLDIRSMPPGTPYPDELRTKLELSAVLLAVIQQGWLERLNQRETEAGPDWVRFEISTALRSGTTIIPVLLDDTAMPTKNQLPPDLAMLAYQQACPLRWTSLDEDMIRLVAAIEPYLQQTNRDHLV